MGSLKYVCSAWSFICLLVTILIIVLIFQFPKIINSSLDSGYGDKGIVIKPENSSNLYHTSGVTNKLNWVYYRYDFAANGANSLPTELACLDFPKGSNISMCLNLGKEPSENITSCLIPKKLNGTYCLQKSICAQSATSVWIGIYSPYEIAYNLTVSWTNVSSTCIPGFFVGLLIAMGLLGLISIVICTGLCTICSLCTTFYKFFYSDVVGSGYIQV
jgi:hypothetical protein